MKFAPIDLDFEGREAALAEVTRYINDMTTVMFYRTNDLIHSRRVLWHLEEALPNILSVYGEDFDVDLARTLALVHDDSEILAGDVQLHDKEQMDEHELKCLAEEEKRIIPEIVKMFGKTANGFDYERLLISAKEKDCLEAQFVSFFDKFDAAGEAWHEVWAGNRRFVFPAGGHNGQSGGYVRRLNAFPKTYPRMVEFFGRFPEYLPNVFDFNSVVERSSLHAEESLEKDTGYYLYDLWKKTVMKHEGADMLVTQVEFPLDND